MCALLVKSSESLETAEFLYEEQYYNSSIHCAYYSCFQLLKHIVINILKENDYDTNVAAMGQGSHVYTINRVSNDIASKIEVYKKFRWLHREIFDLKDIRHKADYSLDLITESESRKAIQGLTKNIINALKLIYNII